MQQIVECVPNFSDGRRPEVIGAITESIRSVPGAIVLDVSSDADHNRSVITFVGSPAAVEEGAFRAITEASRLINLDEHVGEHPRIGATDVCPLVPVKGVTPEECIKLATTLGRRVGEELGIAVYLYGEAALRADRKKLADIRRGQYERWRDEVATNPDRRPDFGPAVAKPWGATVIGVRPFLIAYNLYLNTDHVETAVKIAKAVRFSSGGLRHVQAMGFLVEGQAQVSMNLTDFSKTPIHRVQELVRIEAARYGLEITKAELVGMMPEQALLDSARWYLQLDDFQDDQVLEIKIAQESSEDLAPRAYLDATAAGTPTPGGGSAAAMAGATAAALTQMAANLTAGRKKYQDVEDEMLRILDRVADLRQQLSDAIQEDASAFQRVMDAYRNVELDEEAKARAIESATIYAGEVPLKVARLSREVAELARIVTESGNRNAVTDAASAGVMARAAVQAAAMNVKINAQGLKRPQLTERWLSELAELEAETESLADSCLAMAAERGGF